MAPGMKVVVAPNAFKGTLTAPQAAAAIARGVREVFPDAEVMEVPVADGGDGTVEALVTANRGEYLTAQVEGPLGDPVTARYGRMGSGAVVELAAASGLALIPPERRDPRRASTFGFGQLLMAARRDTIRLIVGIGGSATNDGGAGMAQALGYRLLDKSGTDLPRGGAALARLERIDASGFKPWAPAGEGRVDEQTAYGKAPGEVAKRAQAAGVPVILLAGSKGPGWEALTRSGVTSVVTLTDGGSDLRQALNDPEGTLIRATVVACRSRKWT